VSRGIQVTAADAAVQELEAAAFSSKLGYKEHITGQTR
jgi:hypothetical protein